MSEQARYTVGEELANSATHAAGVLLSIAGLVVMLGLALESGDIWRTVSSVVFGASLIFLYGSSALYHGVRKSAIKARLQQLDHAAIYVLIAGSYTPFMLVSLRGPWGWSAMAFLWSLALAGMVFEFKPGPPSKKVTVGLSVAMGWCVMVLAEPMFRAVAANGLWLLLIGGLFYTAGIGFYLWKKLRYHHAIWHLFVLAGSVAHYFSVLYFVIPVDHSG